MKEKSMTGNEFINSLKAKHKNHDELMEVATVAVDLDISIYEMREALKMTQKELAEKLNMRQSNVSRMEKDLSHARIDTLVKLAAAFGKKLKITFEDVDTVTR